MGMAGAAKQRNVMAELGLKRGGGSDGPAGVRGVDTVTAFPTPLTIAASFDPQTAARYGDLLGQEFFAAGLNTVLGPAMDIARTWHFGRVTESMGEDPFLAASMIGPEIAALQTHHVAATMKHFAAYSEEQNRCGDSPTGERPAVNEFISERALREIYLPAFQAAVRKGGVAEAMCSFPRINGVYACENPYTLGVLKKEWGFAGVVGPDFPDAQRSIVPAFLAGLDSGVMAPPPPGSFFGTAFAGKKSLRQALEDGEVPVSRIDDLILFCK
jgi:beta-glucosidase